MKKLLIIAALAMSTMLANAQMKLDPSKFRKDIKNVEIARKAQPLTATPVSNMYYYRPHGLFYSGWNKAYYNPDISFIPANTDIRFEADYYSGTPAWAYPNGNFDANGEPIKAEYQGNSILINLPKGRFFTPFLVNVEDQQNDFYSAASYMEVGGSTFQEMIEVDGQMICNDAYAVNYVPTGNLSTIYQYLCTNNPEADANFQSIIGDDTYSTKGFGELFRSPAPMEVRGFNMIVLAEESIVNNLSKLKAYFLDLVPGQAVNEIKGYKDFDVEITEMEAPVNGTGVYHLLFTLKGAPLHVDSEKLLVPIVKSTKVQISPLFDGQPRWDETVDQSLGITTMFLCAETADGEVYTQVPSLALTNQEGNKNYLNSWCIGLDMSYSGEFPSEDKYLPDVESIASTIVSYSSKALTFENDTIYPWYSNGSFVRSGNKRTDNSTSTLKFSYSSEYETEVSFDIWKGQDKDYYLNYYVDGSLYDTILNSKQRQKFNLPKGNHMVEIRDSVGLVDTTAMQYGCIDNLCVKEIIGFEDVVLSPKSKPLTFTNEGKYPWKIKDGYIESSNYGNNNSSSRLSTSFTIDTPHKFAFDAYVFSENGYQGYSSEHNLTLYINDIYYIFDNRNEVRNFSLILEPGSYDILWVDSIYNSYDTHFYSRLDNIELSDNWIDIDVKIPGSLGVEVLKHVNVLQDVETLRVKGKLNDEDFAKIGQMKNIIGCDLGQAEFDALPDETFAYLGNLSYVKLPEGLKTIGNMAFYNCRMLRELIMPNSVTNLVTDNNNYGVFENCESLTKLVFSDSLEYLPSSVARDCSLLETVHLPLNLKKIGNRSFYNNNSLTDINIPNTLEQIGSYAFYSCAIDSLSLPESMKLIGEDAFKYCRKLEYLELPSSIESYDGTFDYCDYINTIVVNAIVPPVIAHNDMFYNVPKGNIKLIVPPLGINAYKLDPYWYQFVNIEANNEWCGDIFISSQKFELYLPDDIPADWKTNVTLWDCFGRFNLYGQSTLSANAYLMYEFYEKDDYYYYNIETDPYNYNYCASFINNANMRADSVYIDFRLGEGYWSFISLPFVVSSMEMDHDINFAVRTYSGEARANGNMNETWYNINKWDDLLPNTGFIFHYDNPNNRNNLIQFIAKNDKYKNDIFTNSDVQVNLNEYVSDFAHNRSWNFIGNPYPCFYDTRAMDFTAPITVWDINNQNYAAYSPIDDSYILRPFEAFFVQKPVDADKINFSKEGRQHDRAVRSDVPYRKAAYFANEFKERSVFNITLKDNDGHADRTRFVINDAAERDYEISRDANKFKSENKEIPQIFTIENGVEFSINERPMHDAIIQLGVYAGKSGSYEIGLSGYSDREVILYDNNLGKKVNLTEGSYLFDAEQGADLDRFEIRLGNDVTGVEEISADEQKDTIYDLQGRKLNNVSSKGVFIINGKKVTK